MNLINYGLIDFRQGSKQHFKVKYHDSMIAFQTVLNSSPFRNLKFSVKLILANLKDDIILICHYAI